MDFRQLQYLTAIAEYRNITRAAEALYISQSALSHYLKAAEDELGVQLFDRSTNPISLTYAGERYIESAKVILMENDRLMNELRDVTDHMTGRLRLGISRSRESYTIPRLLPVFARKYSGITVEIYSESGQKLIDALRTGRIDLLLLPDEWKDETKGLSGEYIYSEELVLAARKTAIPAEARSASGRYVYPTALKDMQFFAMPPAHALRIFTENWFRKNRIRPAIKMELSSNISCYRMAASGMGCSIIPYYATRLADPGEEVELFSLEEKPQTWDVHMFFRKDQYLGRPERDMIEIARDVFSNEML